ILPSAAQSVRPRSCQRAEGGNGCEYFQTVTEVGPTPSIGASASPIARGSVARVGTATVLTALCGYAVVYLAARDLAPAGFSVFAVFWGAFGLVTGAANGLLQETTREIRSAGYAEVLPGRRTHPLLPAITAAAPIPTMPASRSGWVRRRRDRRQLTAVGQPGVRA